VIFATDVVFRIFLSAVCCATSSAASTPALPLTDVFTGGRDGYHTYRIPALVVAGDGVLLAFCEGRRGGRSDAGDIDLLTKRSTDGGKTWTPQQVVWDDGENTCGNPCPVVDRTTGTVWLLLTWNHGKDTESQIMQNTAKDTRRVFVVSSDDNGLTWSKPREITGEVKRPEWTWYATGPGIGIQLTAGEWKGRLLIPCDHSCAEASGSNAYGSHVIYSDDHGRTWQLGGIIRPAVNECQVVELTDGTLLINMRNYDRSQTTRALATSTDGGLTWSAIRHDPTLVEPVCQASLLRYATKPPRLAFSNPAHGESGKRQDMTIRVSMDEGRTWPIRRVLWPGPAAYSCLAVLPDGDLACLFEAGEKNPYERIVMARIECNRLDGLEQSR
jgi:sialidase-1